MTKLLALGLICTALLLRPSSVAVPSQAGSLSHVTLSRLWVHSIDPNADSAPVFMAHPGGSSTALVYVLAGNNGSNCSTGDPVHRSTLYALVASTGRMVWSRSTTGPSRCTTAGPAADPSQRWIYAPGLDGKVHRYNARNGSETVTKSWPELVTLMPDVEKMAATPTIASGHLYVTTSGFIGDAGHYQGHLVSINLESGHTNVFNSLCSNVHGLLGPTPGRANYCAVEQSGLFGRGQGAVDPETHDVYVVSGNGPWNGRTNWGDSILKLNSSGARLLDAYTPPNQGSLNSSDADLGSTGPALLPAIRQGSHLYHLLVQGGKGPACSGCQGVALRLLNRDNLSDRGGPGHLGGDLQDLPTPGGCEVLTAPAVWRSSRGVTWVVYANDCGVAGYRLVSPRPGVFRLARAWLSSTGGTTPVVAHGVVYLARGGLIRALDPATGQTLWSGSGIGDVHWQYPLITGSRLFMSDQSGHLTAFSVHR